MEQNGLGLQTLVILKVIQNYKFQSFKSGNFSFLIQI
jgi:hypothetical protein